MPTRRQANSWILVFKKLCALFVRFVKIKNSPTVGYFGPVFFPDMENTDWKRIYSIQ